MAQARTATRAPSRSSKPLVAYHRKRDLKASGEPGGGSRRTTAVPTFVIQKHDATRLHYDFRLEADGVLKSWAVPKGLPTKAGAKSLAIEVEDHPLDYGGFEGTIPEGNYGAGTVMLWDRGVYALEGGDFGKAYRAGRLHLALSGEKIRGEWTLVRMHQRPGEKKTGWLMIRNHASGRIPKLAKARTVPRDNSVLSGLTMVEITAGKKAARRKRSPERPAKEKSDTGEPAPAGPPRFVPPMKALGVTAIPPGDWHSEIKFDGYRALAALARGQPPELWSRNEKSLSADYPELVAALRRLRCDDALIDGEVVALDENGRSHFQLLQQRAAAGTRPPLYYYAFDLLQLNGRSFLDEPIEVRRAALTKLLSKPPDKVRMSAVFDVTPERLLREAAQLGLEGIVAKSAGSLYEAGRRSGAWLKCRISSEQEFVIGGYTPPEGGRSHFGALLIGYHAGGELLYAGKVGTGFDAKRLAELHRLFQSRRRASCPFANLPATNRPRFGQPMNAAAMRKVHWLRPELVCQVKFAEWTEGGNLRHPVFIGLRRDKRASEVVREAGGVGSGEKPES
jgi:bifunctional non-homologous end joining protein LigD